MRQTSKCGPPSLQIRKQKSRNNFQQSLIAAVCNDQTESRRRESSLLLQASMKTNNILTLNKFRF